MERKDRKVGPHGGVLCYIRDDLKYDRRYDLEIKGIECIWIEFFIPKSCECHLIFGEGSCFIRTDVIGTTHSFTCH